METSTIETLEKTKAEKKKRQARTPDYYVEPAVAPEVVTAEIMATVPPPVVKKPRAPKTEAQMEAFKHMIAVRKENLAAKKAGLAVEKIAVKLELKEVVADEKKLIAKQKRMAKKAMPITPPESESEDESEPEVVVVKKAKAKKAVAKKKDKKIVIETTDSEEEDSSSDYIPPVKEFGKSHRNKKSIVKIHYPDDKHSRKAVSINTDDFFC
jgi:hypothetical protein